MLSTSITPTIHRSQSILILQVVKWCQETWTTC